MNFKHALFGLAFVSLGCKEKNESPDSFIQEVKEELVQPEKKKEPPIEVNYQALPFKKSDSGKQYFKEHFSEAEKQIIYSINRIDADNVHRADTLVVPDTFLNDWLLYSPFPKEAEVLQPVNKIVLFFYEIQAFVAYENGKLIRWGPTSMGSKAHPTPTGLHFANWKSKKSISTVKDEWILPWNFNIMNQEGVGWHQYSMPGYPASHSCLRLHEEDAKWLYKFADQWILQDSRTLKANGTPVIVHGAYPFGERRPWYHLLDNPKANSVSEEALREIVEPYLEEILEKQEQRQRVVSDAEAVDTPTKESSQ